MALRCFNTRTRSLEAFVPRDPAGRRVGLYCCGPTVYDLAHIGNFRTFVFADLVRRYLESRGYEVLHVMNITDVEDKIIGRLRAAGRSLGDYTREYEAAFLLDHAALNCLRPHHLPRATEHIPDIIALIQQLADRGLAYQAPDRSVYFSIDRYRAAGGHYGQLVNLDPESLRPGQRVSQDDYTKEALADFALWKARVPEDGPAFWPSPWGEGRPGWHIECSAMSMRLLGPSFDLHLGGEDLIFPHHEDEIAQSEGAGLQPPGEPFVRFWLHGAHLLVEGKKMAKSLGNYYTLRDLLALGYSGRDIRHLLLAAHYRESFNFTLANLEGARSALRRLDDCLGRLAEVAAPSPESADDTLGSSITQALDDDFNVSAAWAALFEWVRDQNRLLAEGQITRQSAAVALAAWRRVDAVFGLGSPADTGVPEAIRVLVDQRQDARQARDYARADALRRALAEKGWIVEDTAKGPRLKRA